MTERSWFILRYNHFPPDTVIKLGQIIANPEEPYQAIDFSGPSPFPPDMPVIPSHEEQFHWDDASGSDGNASLSVQVDGIPVSGSVSAHFKNSTRSWAQFKTLETQLIVPPAQYVKDSMARPTVREFLGNHVMNKSVFMITGLKIARGAERGQERSGYVGGSLQVGITAVPGFPVSLGPDVGGNRYSEEKVSAKATDFVWAFSLRQIHYRRGKVKKENTFLDGATLEERSDRDVALEDERRKKQVLDPSDFEIRVEGLDPNNFAGSQLVSISASHVLDDGQQFLIVENM